VDGLNINDAARMAEDRVRFYVLPALLTEDGTRRWWYILGVLPRLWWAAII